MSSYKGLIFDLDGVIVDTAKSHHIAWKSLADKLKIPFSDAENEKLKGVGRAESLDLILSWGNLDISDPEKEILLKEKNDHYRLLIQEMTPEDILPGVLNFLNTAEKSGIKLAIGSSSKNAVTILEAVGLIERFPVIIDGTKIKHSKPHPEVFEKAASELELGKNECIVFEDAIAGIESAINAGIKCIGVGEANILDKADKVIESFEGKGLEILDF